MSTRRPGTSKSGYSSETSSDGGLGKDGRRRGPVDKASDDYKKRRERNNEAVKKSRSKAKERTAQTQERVSALQSENNELIRRLTFWTRSSSYWKRCTPPTPRLRIPKMPTSWTTNCKRWPTTLTWRASHTNRHLNFNPVNQLINGHRDCHVRILYTTIIMIEEICKALVLSNVRRWIQIATHVYTCHLTTIMSTVTLLYIAVN